MQSGKIGCIRTLELLNRLSQNFARVLVMTPRMPKLKAITPVRASYQMGEILLLRDFLACFVFL